MADKAND